jgi:hypothetical protein
VLIPGSPTPPLPPPGGGTPPPPPPNIDDVVPCAGPTTGGTWKNHGKYVSTVAKTARNWVRQGLVTKAERAEIVADAARSECGKKIKPPKPPKSPKEPRHSNRGPGNNGDDDNRGSNRGKGSKH